MKNIKYILLASVLTFFVSCNKEEDVDLKPLEEAAELPALTAGSADFSTYVSLGNSLTAGFTDGALFKAGQENSMSNILSQKFALVGGGEFSQPLMNDNIGGLLFGGNPMPNGSFGPRLYFYSDSDPACPDLTGPKVLGIDPTNDQSTATLPTTEAFAETVGSKNNMGVPGAASFHLLFDGYGNPANLATATANPYFVRMASTPNATVLGDALAQSPTFVSLWIGNNDVLGYATSGGSTGAITPKSTFDFSITTIMAALAQANVKGVMANIPDIATVPHFTTVPYNPLDPNDECTGFGAQVALLNSTFAPLNAAFDFLGMPERAITYSATDPSPLLIHDESLPNIQAQLNQVLIGGGLDAPTAGVLSAQFAQSRQATENDLFVLTSASVIATVNVPYFTQLVTAGVPAATAGQLSVNGVTFPLEDKWVLLPSEQDEIKIATDDFNVTIQNAATTAGFAFVDANVLLNQLANGGITSGEFTLTADLVTGSAFSLDGIHPTARGYALLANEFMKAIDATYGSNFEASGNFVNVGNYPTNYSPAFQ